MENERKTPSINIFLPKETKGMKVAYSISKTPQTSPTSRQITWLMPLNRKQPGNLQTLLQYFSIHITSKALDIYQYI